MFKNDRIFLGNLSNPFVASLVDSMFSDFLWVLKFSPSFDSIVEEMWTPPSIMAWKINCDATFKNGMATLGVVLKDDCGTLIKESTKILICSSTLEAEVKVVEWGQLLRGRNLVFSSDALMVVEEINSNDRPKGWFTSEGITNTHNILTNNNWKLLWNRQTSLKFTDELAKLALITNSSFHFTSSNLDSLPKAICNIYLSEIMEGTAFVLTHFRVLLCLVASRFSYQKKTTTNVLLDLANFNTTQIQMFFTGSGLSGVGLIIG